MKANAALSGLGIDRCFLKLIDIKRDGKNIAKKRHYHTDVEVHVIVRGNEEYDICGERALIEEGSLLFISPGIKHTVVSTDEHSLKYAVSFKTVEGGKAEAIVSDLPDYVLCKAPGELISAFMNAERESEIRAFGYREMLDNAAVQCVISLMREIANPTEEQETASNDEEDVRLIMAKQFIVENIEMPPSVADVAAYCYLGQRQLSRIFNDEEGIDVSDYIRKKRCEHIERLLAEEESTLAEIAERTGFRNEFYFNSFCKKYIGTTPGAYRRALNK